MHRAKRKPSDTRRRNQEGLSLVEFLVATFLVLLVALAIYEFVDWSRKTYIQQTDESGAQAMGRVALDILASDIHHAGYSPIGAHFLGVPSGTTRRIQLLSDRDGDGVVGAAGEVNENITYLFTGPDTEGLYELFRGVDLNGDGDFEDTDESSFQVASNMVQIDYDGDTVIEQFLAYDAAPGPPPPFTTRVIITFGIRGENPDLITGGHKVINFQCEATLRNEVLR